MAHPLIEQVACWALAGIFAAAATHKLRNYQEFLGILDQYRIMPKAFVPLVAPLVALLEVGVGLALVLPAWQAVGAAAATGLLVAYLIAIGFNLYGRRRTSIDCGCGGEPTPLSGWLLVRNLVLLSLTPVAFARTESVEAMVYPLAAVATLFLWFAYGAANQLLANQGGAGIADG